MCFTNSSPLMLTFSMLTMMQFILTKNWLHFGKELTNVAIMARLGGMALLTKNGLLMTRLQKKGGKEKLLTTKINSVVNVITRV